MLERPAWGVVGALGLAQRRAAGKALNRQHSFWQVLIASDEMWT